MNEIKEVLKLAMDSMKNRTLEKLLNLDTEYQKRDEEFKQAYQLFKELDLTEEQKNVIETMIARDNERAYDYTVNTYMAGLIDCYMILKMFDLTHE